MGQKGQKQTQPGLLMSYPCVSLIAARIPYPNPIESLSKIESHSLKTDTDVEDLNSPFVQ